MSTNPRIEAVLTTLDNAAHELPNATGIKRSESMIVAVQASRLAARSLAAALREADAATALEKERDELRAALKLCLTEIQQSHHDAYPTCEGGCPAHEAMVAARKALGEVDG